MWLKLFILSKFKVDTNDAVGTRKHQFRQQVKVTEHSNYKKHSMCFFSWQYVIPIGKLMKQYFFGMENWIVVNNVAFCY